MKKKEFCNEIINQINYFLGKENKIIKLNDNIEDRINQLLLTLTSYTNNFEEYHYYVTKIYNQICYSKIALSYIIDFL